MSGYPKITEFDLDSKREWNEVNKDWYIQEKIDGSQLSVSFVDGSLVFWNKSKKVSPQAKVFAKACAMIMSLRDKLDPRFRYHGEAVCARYNQYERVPAFYWILYDLQEEETKKYLPVDQLEAEAKRNAAIHPATVVQDLIEKIERGELTSTLGGNQIEGIVLKHPHYTSAKGVVSTKQKFVSSQFKERHATKQVNKTSREMSTDDFLEMIGSQFNTKPRFHKAVQHLKENEQFIAKPNHVYKIAQELDSDFEAEYKALIQEYLWVEFGPKILAAARKDFPEWYTRYLTENNQEVDQTTRESGATADDGTTTVSEQSQNF